jgi:hypothetical protein
MICIASENSELIPAEARLRKDEVSRKDAKSLRSRGETGFLDLDAFFASWRLGAKNFSFSCIAEVSRKDAKALRFFASQAGRRSTSFAA